jgi:hypothetical protein
LAVIAAPANQNENAPKLLEKTVKAANGQTKVLVADSSRKLRRHIHSHGMKPAIPIKPEASRSRVSYA